LLLTTSGKSMQLTCLAATQNSFSSSGHSGWHFTSVHMPMLCACNPLQVSCCLFAQEQASIQVLSLADKQFLTQPIAAAETIEVIYLLLESQAQCTNLSLSFYIRLPEVQGLALTLTTLASHAQVYTAELVQNTFARDLEERQTIHECLSSAVFQLVTQVNAVSIPTPH
jgi:hypothetical protein